MPRNDQAVRQLIILKKLESSRHGLTLEQLADSSALRQLVTHEQYAEIWTPSNRPGIHY